MAERIEIRIDPDLEDLVPGFLDNRRRDVERIGSLLDASDFDELRLIGHSMKGAGGGYGFDAITDYGATIEDAALRGDAAAVREATAALADYLARVDVVPDEE